MHRMILRPLIAVLAILAVSCGSRSYVKETATEDSSVYSPDNIKKLASTDYDAAMELTDEALRKGQMSAFVAYELKSNITYQNTEDNTSAAMWLNKALEQDEAQDPSVRVDLLYHLATILKGGKDYTQCLATCADGKELAHSIGNIYLQHSFDFVAGSCLIDMGEDDKGFELMKDAIAGASSVAKSEEDYGHLAFFVSSLINSYLAIDNYDSALEQCNTYEKLLAKIPVVHPNFPAGFLDRSYFYLDRDRAICYAKTGKAKKASEAFSKAQSRNFAKSKNGRINLVNYYAAIGDPDSILAIYNDIPYCDADTVSRAYRRRLARLSEAYHTAGLTKEAAEYDARYEALTEQIKQKEQAEGTFAKAAEYDSQRYRLSLGDTMSLLQIHQRNFIILMLFIALLFFVFLILNHCFSKRKEMKHNKETETLVKGIKSLQKQVSLIAERELYSGETPEKNATLAELIEGNSLYLNKNLTRDSAAVLLGISQSEITRMLGEIEPGLSFPEYIKGLRIRHALKILGENPDISITELADRCGFYTVRTLQRAFLTITGQTPSEYAKKLKKQ